MREWKRGEVQAIGVAAKLMIIGGFFVALGSLWLDFDSADFVEGLPRTLVSGPFATTLVAGVVFLLGCTLAVWLHRVQKRAGISTQPFDREDRRKGKPGGT
jgi:hypothetical protein